MKKLLERMGQNARFADTVSRLRLELTIVALRQHPPDLIILDEFQRFFEFLAPNEDEGDSVYACTLMKELIGDAKILAGRRAPAVLLLSATPYLPYAGWSEGGSSFVREDSKHQHDEQFFRLLGFLFGGDGAGEVTKAHDLYKEYGGRLRRDPIKSKEVLRVRDRIEKLVGRVMARTERPVEKSNPREPLYEQVAVEDMQLFHHLVKAAKPEHAAMATPLWSSIPYPLQMMDDRYVLRRDARPPRLRITELGSDAVMKYKAVKAPHPRLRCLQKEVPVSLLSQPWLVPTRPWWALGGVFKSAAKEHEEDRGQSKVLVFSRYRAVPRAIASLLSYQVEQGAFHRKGYDYKARRRAAGEGTRETNTRRSQPAASFGFAKTNKDPARLVPMFFPMPTLAHLGDPLDLPSIENGEMTFERAVGLVARKIEDALGGRQRHAGRPLRHSLWRWVRTIEERSPTFAKAKDGWESWTRGAGGKRMGGAKKALEEFLGEESPAYASDELPTRRELRELAKLALTAPGNVVLRATGRVFTRRTDSERIKRVTGASVGGLRNYLDTPELHCVLATRGKRGRGGHPEAVRQAIWDGNLESVLDEYLTVLRGLGVSKVRGDAESSAFENLEEALHIRTSNVDVRPPSGKKTFRLRCHVALPFGLKQGDLARESTGKARSDALRTAFNSPFRPFVLASTSIGQEGLDLHSYCNHIVHWDLPSNPVDLEQREGRVDRYCGLGVRRALAKRSKKKPTPGRSLWRDIAAEQAKTEDRTGMAPWWHIKGLRILKRVYMPVCSCEKERLDKLETALALYRFAIGQTDQEGLIRALERRREEENGKNLDAWLEEAAISFSPLHSRRGR